MAKNPFKDNAEKIRRDSSQFALAIGKVVESPDDSAHMVAIEPITRTGPNETVTKPVPATVAVQRKPEIGLPSVGDLVVFGRFQNNRNVVLGTLYSKQSKIADYNSEDRVLGNNDASITIDESGEIRIDPESGESVRISGDVISTDGGGTPVSLERDGTEVYSDVEGLNFADGVDVTDDGDGTVTISVSSTAAYTDEAAQDAIGNILSGQFTYDDVNNIINLDPHSSTSDAHHTRYTDSEAESAINNDGDHGSTASHNYFSGSHLDLTNISTDAHHTRYADEEAQDAAASMITGGTDIDITYDDANDTLTIDYAGHSGNLVYSDSDTNTSTAISWDTGTIPEYDMYIVEIIINSHTTSMIKGYMTINNNSTSTYDFLQRTGSNGLYTGSNITAWDNIGRNTRGGGWSGDVRIGNPEGRTSAAGIYPTITSNVNGEVGVPHLVRGMFKNAVSVDSIQYNTSGPSTGSIKVRGKDIT